MSRETIVGLVAALRVYLELDEGRLFGEWERRSAWMAERLSGLSGVSSGVFVERTVEDGEAMWPLVYVEVERGASVSARGLSGLLREGDPSVESGVRGDRLLINPEFLLEGDEVLIAERIREVLAGLSR